MVWVNRALGSGAASDNGFSFNRSQRLWSFPQTQQRPSRHRYGRPLGDINIGIDSRYLSGYFPCACEYPLSWPKEPFHWFFYLPACFVRSSDYHGQLSFLALLRFLFGHQAPEVRCSVKCKGLMSVPCRDSKPGTKAKDPSTRGKMLRTELPGLATRAKFTGQDP